MSFPRYFILYFAILSTCLKKSGNVHMEVSGLVKLTLKRHQTTLNFQRTISSTDA